MKYPKICYRFERRGISNKEKEAGKIDLYEAIGQMKRISLAGGTFSIKFRKWNQQTQDGGDMVTVQAARIRPKASDEKISHSSFKFFSPT